MFLFLLIAVAVSVPRQRERGAVHEARARLPRLRRRHGERQGLLEDRRDRHGRARQVKTAKTPRKYLIPVVCYFLKRGVYAYIHAI